MKTLKTPRYEYKPPSLGDILRNSHELIDEIITASLIRMSEQKRLKWRATKDFLSGDITIDLLLDGRPLFNEGYEYEEINGIS